MQEKPRDQENRTAEIEQAIEAQEAQRSVLGDDLVDTTIRALRSQLEALHTASQPGADQERLLHSIHGHIPAALAEKMMAVGEIKGERRQVTVVFADLSGFTALSEALDPEEVAGLIQELLKELALSIFEYEGYVDKFIGDAVMAVFGAPVSHEDDAERALRSALSMMDRLGDYNKRHSDRITRPMGLHIGVNTGLVVAGNVNSGLRMPYSVIGDTVNIASRLEGAAQTGQILVSQSTYRLTREAFAFRALEPLLVKGKAHPLTVYELLRARLSPTKTRGLRNLGEAFVGREKDMNQLQAITDELQSGRGSILLVTGEAGIGKSRLMAEWRRKLEGAGKAIWLEGRCHSTTTPVAYSPFLDLIRRHSGIEDEQTEEMARRRLTLTVERFFPADARAQAMAAYLLGFSLSAGEQNLLDAIPAMELRERIHGLLKDIFIVLMKEGPVVLVIEDMQWADATSLELMKGLFGLVETHSIALVGVSRPTGKLTTLRTAAGRHEKCLVSLKLCPLTEEGSTQLIGGLLEMHEPPESLRELVVERAEGNPFFVEEMISTLIEQEALERGDGGAWITTSRIDTVTVPETLHGLLMARLDALPLETKWLAQQAAVIGRIFLYRVLRELVGSVATIDDGLGRMEHDELIRKRITDPELEYMFRHALTQEVAYGSLLVSKRKELHRSVGTAMAKVFADRIGEFAGVIGEHFYKGEAWEEAADYLIRTGDASFRLSALVEARSHYVHALDALERAPDTEDNRRRQVDTAVKFASAAVYGLPPQQVLERIGKMEEIAGSLPGPDGSPGGDKARLALVRCRIGHAYFQGNRIREAIGYLKPVLEAARELNDPDCVGIPSFVIGSALCWQGHLGKARGLLTQAIPALEKTGNRFELTRALGSASLALSLMGDHVEGHAMAERAVRQAHEMKSPLLIAMGSCFLTGGLVHSDYGEERSLDASLEGLKVAEQVGDPFLLYITNANRGWNLEMLGRYEEAAHSIAMCEEKAAQIGEQIVMMDLMVARKAEVALGLGDVEAALALTAKAIGIAGHSGSIWTEGIARRTRAKALATLDPARWEEAEKELAQSLELFRSGQNLMEEAYLQVTWGRLCNGRGDSDAARAHWQAASGIYEAKQFPRWSEKVRALLAVVGA